MGVILTTETNWDDPPSIFPVFLSQSLWRAGVAWPAVLVLRPGPDVPGTLDADPPDGTMMAFCGLPGLRLNR